MEIEYFSETRYETDQIDLYRALKWYGLKGYTSEDIERITKNSFYSVYAYDGFKLVGLGRVASDGQTAAIMSGICVRDDYRRRGIGEEIVTRLVYYCQSGEYKMNVQLFCEDSLRKWYYKQGFVDYGAGMRKLMVLPEDPCLLRKNFKDVYGIEQLINLSEDFYWNYFISFGEFKYHNTMNSRGEMVPSFYIDMYGNEPSQIAAEFVFENVHDLQIRCNGIETKMREFDIVDISEDGNEYNYCIRTLNNTLNFMCENFRIINVEPRD